MASKIREANAAGAKHAYIELLPHDEWKELKNRLPNAYFGAMEHLKTIVEHVVKDLGSELGSVNQVVFKTHDGKLFPMSVSPSK